METKHTPGPWAYKWNGSYYDVDIAHTDDRILSVAVMLYDENVVSLTDTDENKANAILIAAAPEMLDMLERAKSAMGVIRRSISAHPDCTEGSEFDDMTTTAQEMGDEIEALIKKAKLHETRKHNK